MFMKIDPVIEPWPARRLSPCAGVPTHRSWPPLLSEKRL